MPAKGAKGANKSTKKEAKHHDSAMLTLLQDVHEQVQETQLEYTEKFLKFTQYTEKCFNELRALVKSKEEEMQKLVDKYENKSEKHKEHSKQSFIDFQMNLRTVFFWQFIRKIQ